MKNVVLKLTTLLLIFSLVSCSEDEPEAQRNDTSIVPTDFMGRDNVLLGELNVAQRDVTISVWDHGQIDGDIVSIYVNGRLIIDEKTLDGPANKLSVTTTLEFNGYNYVLLFAHNEGSISPNTATISIDDGTSAKNFVLSSNLLTNGVVDLVVN